MASDTFFLDQLSSLALHNSFRKLTLSPMSYTRCHIEGIDRTLVLLEAFISSAFMHIDSSIASYFCLFFPILNSDFIVYFPFQFCLAFYTRFSTLFAYPLYCLLVYQKLVPFCTLPWAPPFLNLAPGSMPFTEDTTGETIH